MLGKITVNDANFSVKVIHEPNWSVCRSQNRFKIRLWWGRLFNESGCWVDLVSLIFILNLILNLILDLSLNSSAKTAINQTRSRTLCRLTHTAAFSSALTNSMFASLPTVLIFAALLFEVHQILNPKTVYINRTQIVRLKATALCSPPPITGDQ